jgi:hypothetical protein
MGVGAKWRLATRRLGLPLQAAAPVAALDNEIGAGRARDLVLLRAWRSVELHANGTGRRTRETNENGSPVMSVSDGRTSPVSASFCSDERPASDTTIVRF